MLLLLTFVILPGDARAWGLSEPPCAGENHYEGRPYNPAQARYLDLGFRPPVTEPETVLDCIVRTILFDSPEPWLRMRDHGGRPYVYLSEVAEASGAFTTAYLVALSSTPFRKNREPCGRGYDKTRCGFDEEVPPVCHDGLRFPLYRTVRGGTDEALIRSLSGTFRLVREEGRWKIDGSICSKGALRGVGFNWKGQRSER